MTAIRDGGDKPMRQTLSTLRRTVEAMGGNQAFRAVFDVERGSRSLKTVTHIESAMGKEGLFD